MCNPCAPLDYPSSALPSAEQAPESTSRRRLSVADVLAFARAAASRSALPKADREAATTLVRAGITVLTESSPRLVVVAAVRTARRALAGTRDGGVFQIRSLARVLSVLERAWVPGNGLEPRALSLTRSILESIDERLGRISEVDVLATLRRLRLGQVTLTGAVVDVLLATRALDTAKVPRRKVESRVRRALAP